MRSTLPNLFASYQQAENQMTNALAQTLARDRAVLSSFVERFASRTLPRGDISVMMQARPAELGESGPEPRRPDAWIIGDELHVAIESKTRDGKVDSSQLKGHLRLIPRPGTLLVLSPERGEPAAIAAVRAVAPQEVGVSWHSWIEVHDWAASSLRAKIASGVGRLLLENLKEYLEMRELSGFTGVDLADGYEYPRAKATIRGLAAELLPEVSRLYPGMSVSRSQVRDDVHPDGARLVWLAFSEAHFTAVPHFTLALLQPFTRVALTVPNGARGSWTKLRRLLLQDADTLRTALRDFHGAVEKARMKNPPVVRVRVYQRHWPEGIRSRHPVWDAEIDVALATAVATRGELAWHHAWWEATLTVLRSPRGRANRELQFSVDYSNLDPLVQSPAFVKEAVRTVALFRRLYELVRP